MDVPFASNWLCDCALESNDWIWSPRDKYISSSIHEIETFKIESIRERETQRETFNYIRRPRPEKKGWVNKVNVNKNKIQGGQRIWHYTIFDFNKCAVFSSRPPLPSRARCELKVDPFHFYLTIKHERRFNRSCWKFTDKHFWTPFLLHDFDNLFRIE